MNIGNAKLQLFYIRKSFFEHKAGWKFLYNRYVLAKKILKNNEPVEKVVNNHDLSMHTLTGHRDVMLLVWAFASYYATAKTFGTFYIHSDGSLTKKDKEILKRFFPSARIVEPEDVLKKLEKFGHYSNIKKFRTDDKYVLLKKLLDPYIISDKKHILFLDTDILWFKGSGEVEENIKNGCPKSIFMDNNGSCYVHFKDGTKLSDDHAQINSGITLFTRENLSLEKLSEYFEKFDTENKTHGHFIEQAGYAYAMENISMLPIDRYTIQKKVDESVVCRHYTSPRRAMLYIEGIEKLKETILK